MVNVHALRATVFTACLCAAIAGLAAGASKPRPKPIAPTPEQRREIRRLSRLAMGSDARDALEALTGLKKMGDVARREMLLIANRRLSRQKQIVLRAARGVRSPDKVADAERQITELRASAWENIGKLDKKGETIRIATENYTRLIEMHKALAPLYAQRAAVIKALAMRPELVAICRQAGGETAKRYSPEAEKKITELAEKSLGMTLSEARAIPAFNGGKGPEKTAAKGVWHFDACRRIEAYNAKLRRHMTPGEAENLRLTNDYREALGALRYEIDIRLVQSARRHSKEMTDLGYFSHSSPTPANASFGNRVRNAGYPSPAGENIASGARSGTAAFWMWFRSPGHHKNMVNPGNVAMGVGKWAGKWTQNMGRGKRVMLMNKADRANAKIKGKLLPPQR